LKAYLKEKNTNDALGMRLSIGLPNKQALAQLAVLQQSINKPTKSVRGGSTMNRSSIASAYSQSPAKLGSKQGHIRRAHVSEIAATASTLRILDTNVTKTRLTKAQ
jgi:hypothetical protein